MTRFAQRGHFVRWAEPRYLRWFLDRPRDFLRARDEHPLPNLEVRVRTLVNGERLPFIRAHNKFWLAQTLCAPLPRDAAGPRVLWLYNPHEAHLAERVPHDLLVYDIMDEYQGFPWSPPRIAEEERALLARADWVFAGTQALYDAKHPFASGKIECILSGVETEIFEHPAPNPEVEQELNALRARHPKLAGYAGMIDLRLDQDLLIQAARRFADWGFVLAGPAACDVSRLAAQPNIHLVGQQPYAALPAWYRGWDAALLPFVENDLTRHINPTKMLEYAAAGVPILARALPDVKTFYANGAWLYETTEEFMAQMQQMAAATPDEIEAKLAAARAWAAERSWDALAARMLERVTGLLYP
jgi:glycosyltransferase involved in cell wall biosynthesis